MIGPRAILSGLLAIVAGATTLTPRVYAGDRVVVSVNGPVCDAIAYGAKGDGRSDDTAALMRAIAACSGASGGSVIITRGHVFKTWGIAVSKVSHFALLIEGELSFFNDTKAWQPAGKPCIAFSGGASIAIVSTTGEGRVDGGGSAWWPTPKAFRPGLLTVNGVTELLIKAVTFVDSPNHSLELYADNQEVFNTSIFAPASTAVLPSHNTDGIDVHGSPAWIHECKISVGDDHIAIHASDVLVSDCTFGTGHGTSIGSLGGALALSNITIRNSAFRDATTAIRIKSDTGATGYLRDVLWENITLHGVEQTVQVCQFYDVDGVCNYPGEQPRGVKAQDLTIQVRIADVAAVDSGIAGQLTCAPPPAPACSVTLERIVHTGAVPKPWVCASADTRGSEGNVPAVGGCA